MRDSLPFYTSLGSHRVPNMGCMRQCWKGVEYSRLKFSKENNNVLLTFDFLGLVASDVMLTKL